MNVAKTPQFVTTNSNGSAQPLSVQKILPLEPYLVQYVDGEGKQEVRVVLKVPNSDVAYTVQPALNGSRIICDTKSWFQKAFAKALEVQKRVFPGKEMAPEEEEGVQSL